MLQKLTINNVALIDSVEINFDKGLNVLSGETGAGKSIIIEALNFVLGAKADKSFIRNGENECFVKVEFDVDKNPLIEALFDEFDMEKESVLIISRKITIDGKNSIKINGNTATLSMVKRFTSVLVDVHGQSEHFYLLKEANQLALIDKYCGEELAEIKNNVFAEYSNYKKILEEIDAIGGDESQRLTRIDILNYQIDEIEKVDLKENEEEELLEIRKKIINQEKILNSLNAVKSAIYEEGGADDILSNADRFLTSISNYGENYSKLEEKLNAVISDLDDVLSDTERYIEDLGEIDYNPEEIEERLLLIKNIKKKYGASYEEINNYLLNAKQEREKLLKFDETYNDLLKQRDNSQDKLYDFYLKMSNVRKKYSKMFCDNIIDEVRSLGMLKASFYIAFNDTPKKVDCEYNLNGFDRIQFMFSANLGEEERLLSQVISGGEVSRFMLAMKSSTSKLNNISTFIFDEIDTGISGEIAKIVAQKFAKIALNTQIIAISHLPQISAMADNNLLIVKSETNNRTVTTVDFLSKEDKVLEVVRLVGGNKNSEFAINHAKELIEEANKYKKSLLDN